MNHSSLLAALLLAAASSVYAQTAIFDGDWNVTMVCPPHNASDDDAKGYTHRFSGKIVNGELSATHGTEGEPGWHFLRGSVQPDGEAKLRLDGIVNKPDHAINNAERGKPYSYRVNAKFEQAAGSGQRATGRVCEFRFTR